MTTLDPAPLGVIEGDELDEHVFAGGVVWLLFTRHRRSCLGGVDPTLCGCAAGGGRDGWHVYPADPGTPGAVPVTQGRRP